MHKDWHYLYRRMGVLIGRKKNGAGVLLFVRGSKGEKHIVLGSPNDTFVRDQNTRQTTHSRGTALAANLDFLRPEIGRINVTVNRN